MSLKKRASKKIISAILITSISMIPITNLSYADESFDNISNKMIDNINIMGDLQELDNLNYYSELLSKYDLTKERIENLVEKEKILLLILKCLNYTLMIK